MKKLKIGDVFEIDTSNGKAYLHYAHKKETGSTIVRVLPGLYQKKPDNLESIVHSKELYILSLPVEAAIRNKFIEKVGHVELLKEFEMPKYMKTEHINFDDVKGWHIINTSNLHREFVTTLTEEQKSYSPWASWNIHYLKEKLSKGWTLDKWTWGN